MKSQEKAKLAKLKKEVDVAGKRMMKIQKNSEKYSKKVLMAKKPTLAMFKKDKKLITNGYEAQRLAVMAHYDYDMYKRKVAGR